MRSQNSETHECPLSPNDASFVNVVLLMTGVWVTVGEAGAGPFHKLTKCQAEIWALRV